MSISEKLPNGNIGEIKATIARLSKKRAELAAVIELHEQVLRNEYEQQELQSIEFKMDFELRRILAILPEHSVPHGICRIALEELRSVGRLPLCKISDLVLTYTGVCVPFKNGYAAITIQYQKNVKNGVSVDLNLFNPKDPRHNGSHLSQIGIRILGGLPEVSIGIGEVGFNEDQLQGKLTTSSFPVPNDDTRENIELRMGDVANDAVSAIRQLSTKWLLPKSPPQQ